MERVQDAPAFLDAGITDVHLPLGHETGKKSKLYSYSDHTKEVSVALQWQAKHFDLFDQYQSYMLSPFFELKKGEVPYYELHAESVLPFIENKSTERRLLGLHGTVYRVKIHPAHHDLHEGLDKTDDRGRNPPFAVKELTEKGMEEEVGFQKEVEAWRRCAGIHGHDHLIKILAVWRQKNAWNLLQPWADGNLWDYWEERNSANRDLGLTTWILDQLLGLAEALRQIHRRRTGDLEVRLWGIHGDIKPHNILWFKESTPESNPMGRLVICDFGFTSFHTKASISKVQPEGHSPTYQAPEYGAESGISQAYDFWSLGCVYLEFITWYLLGYEDVKYTFANQRTDDDKAKFFPGDKFFNQDEEGKAFVKDSVYKWIWHLRSLAHCSELFHDLLDLVEKKLLVTNAQERQLNCQDLVRRLSKLQRDCEARGVAYAVGGACYMPQLNHPGSTEDASMWAGRPASSPLGPPRLTYLSVTSDESREVEARDLVGIDPRISTRPPQQDLIRASNHSSRLSRDITHEETPLLEQQRTSCRESGRPQKKHQASQSPGQFLQDTQVDEIAIDSGRNNSDKINQVDKDTGLTALMKNWLKGLFQCSKYRHKKGHT
ncbi:putative serine/threonine-protein kinase tsuA [Cytospora mali]|uniref:Serine/threonine-protein kinase tsuA n=1 Tax=Cytospora mali TaxID=578113 RepID=A0A194VWC6_CYTMA|nr:putative serine/threonine-protein kinase tsuA [Valsa mali]